MQIFTVYCIKYSYHHRKYVISNNAYLLQRMFPMLVWRPDFLFMVVLVCIIMIHHLGEANNTEATVFPPKHRKYDEP